VALAQAQGFCLGCAFTHTGGHFREICAVLLAEHNAELHHLPLIPYHTTTTTRLF
jgi:hypothetical protein